MAREALRLQDRQDLLLIGDEVFAIERDDRDRRRGFWIGGQQQRKEECEHLRSPGTCGPSSPMGPIRPIRPIGLMGPAPPKGVHMSNVAAVALLAQPQLEGVNYTIFWTVVGVLLVVIAILVWRNFAKPKPAPEDVPTVPPEPIKPSCEPLRLLAILQREGRLVDFLLEDVDAYTDDQVGAAVRDIHRNCRKAILDHLVLEPVLPEAEGVQVTVPAAFDPSAVRVTG